MVTPAQASMATPRRKSGVPAQFGPSIFLPSAKPPTTREDRAKKRTNSVQQPTMDVHEHKNRPPAAKSTRGNISNTFSHPILISDDEEEEEDTADPRSIAQERQTIPRRLPLYKRDQKIRSESRPTLDRNLGTFSSDLGVDAWFDTNKEDGQSLTEQKTKRTKRTKLAGRRERQNGLSRDENESSDMHYEPAQKPMHRTKRVRIMNPGSIKPFAHPRDNEERMEHASLGAESILALKADAASIRRDTKKSVLEREYCHNSRKTRESHFL